MDKIDKQMWKALSEASAISGYEQYTYGLAEQWLGPYVDELTTDRLMSTIGIHQGKKEGVRLLFTAHMDEVGFQVKAIDEDGYILLQNVGGWWNHMIPAHLFQIETQNHQKIMGVVGGKPPHGLSKQAKETVLSLEELFLDIGVTSRQEVLDLGIAVGDQITPYAEMIEMNHPDFLLGKAWDDRSCVGIEWELARRIQTVDATVYFAMSAQEEVGQRGARTLAHQINPDLHIALDVTNALDTPYEKGDIRLGGGPVLTVMDASSMAHPELFYFVENICKTHHIPIQYSCSKSGGTDNGNVHKSNRGIIGMTISLPSRYMHSSYSIIHQKDIIQVIELLEAICKEITKEDVEKIKDYNR